MQTRSYDENSVRPSVCPSVCHTRALWQNGRKLCLDFYITRKNIYPSFPKRRMVGGGDPSAKNFGSTGPRWSEITDFEPIIARSASAVIPSETSSINTNRKSTTRFPMCLIMIIVRCPYLPQKGGGGSKMHIGRFSSESLLQSFFVWKLSAAKL